MKLKEVNELEVLKVMNSMSSSTAASHDKIDSKSVKMAAGGIYKQITRLVNMSIRSKKFPNKWKIGKVLPLLKSKEMDPKDPKSYRPITLLATVSKITEKIVQTQIQKHMEKSKMFNTNNHAYRALHSTTTAMMELADMIQENSDNQKISTIIALDQSAAFDCVVHSVLLDKMKIYNFEPDMIEWMRNYLGHRTNYVSIGNKKSAMTMVGQGVPQGSVLGPVLYCIYVNELSEVVRDSECPEHRTRDVRIPVWGELPQMWTRDQLRGRRHISCGN